VTAVEPLSTLFALDEVDTDTFEGPTHGTDAGVVRIYGGFVLGQALLAAARTVPDGRQAHSVHGAFLRSGRPGEPVRYSVSRDRDGQAFSTRMVTARQGPNVIFEGTVSFHVDEPGADWTATPMPEVPAPEDVPFTETVLTTLPTLSVFEQRLLVQLDANPGPLAPGHPQWVRPLGDLPAGPHVARALIASLSDLGAVRGSMRPGFEVPYGQFTGASLDHAVWVHRQPRVDDWLLITMEPLSNHGARGLGIGRAWDRDGTHVATWVQEALLRVK
jgi:acyl-CoA thioesterase-2